MSPLLVFFTISIALVSAQDGQRNSRIRFPTEASQVAMGQQPYTSESQVQPIIITAGNGILATPHYVIPKAPSLTNPFGQVGEKGYAEGVIIPHQHTKNQQEYHQTVPPPHQLFFGPPESYFFQHQEHPEVQNTPPNRHPQHQSRPQYQQNKPSYQSSKPPHYQNKPKQPQNKGPRPQTKPPTQNPERHRFSGQRLTYNQLKQLHPTQHAKQEIYASGMQFSSDPTRPDVASYSYSIVTNHGANDPESHPDFFEMEINHGVQDFPSSEHKFPQTRPSAGPSKQNSFYKTKPQQNTVPKPKVVKRPQSSDGYFDSNEGIADWEIKGNFEDIPTQSELFFNQNKKGNRQQSNRHSPNVNNKKASSTTRPPQRTYHSHTSQSGKDDKPKRFQFSGFPTSEHFTEAFKQFGDFPEFPSSQKRYFPTKGNSGYKQGEVKSVYPYSHGREQEESKPKKKFHHDFQVNFDNFRSIDASSDSSGENFSPEFDYDDSPFPHHKDQKANINLRGDSYVPQKSVKNTQTQQASDEFNDDFDFPDQSFKKDKEHNKPNVNYDFNFDYPQKSQKKQKKHQTRPSHDFDYDYLEQLSKNAESHFKNSNFGSEWIPINAPAGAVPAKSYDIPAPDLSRGSFQENESTRIDRKQGDEEDEGSLVYGVRKREGSEGVVSAVFRVNNK